MRHSCEESDNFQNYGWKKHDGKYFATQEILDSSSNFNLTTVFMKAQLNYGGISFNLFPTY